MPGSLRRGRRDPEPSKVPLASGTRQPCDPRRRLSTPPGAVQQSYNGVRRVTLAGRPHFTDLRRGRTAPSGPHTLRPLSPAVGASRDVPDSHGLVVTAGQRETDGNSTGEIHYLDGGESSQGGQRRGFAGPGHPHEPDGPQPQGWGPSDDCGQASESASLRVRPRVDTSRPLTLPTLGSPRSPHGIGPTRLTSPWTSAAGAHLRGVARSEALPTHGAKASGSAASGPIAQGRIAAELIADART
jgi:hypothetical protein